MLRTEILTYPALLFVTLHRELVGSMSILVQVSISGNRREIPEHPEIFGRSGVPLSHILISQEAVHAFLNPAPYRLVHTSSLLVLN